MLRAMFAHAFSASRVQCSRSRSVQCKYAPLAGGRRAPRGRDRGRPRARPRSVRVRRVGVSGRIEAEYSYIQHARDQTNKRSSEIRKD
eukprot:4974631-Pleurochrysis_carterae.AAC.2